MIWRADARHGRHRRSLEFILAAKEWDLRSYGKAIKWPPEQRRANMAHQRQKMRAQILQDAALADAKEAKARAKKEKKERRDKKDKARENRRPR